MALRVSLTIVSLLLIARLSLAQPQLIPTNPSLPSRPWQQPKLNSTATSPDANQSVPSPTPLAARSQPITKTQFNGGNAELPRAHGQTWREYDISAYTARISTTANPQQAIVDWILRETGTDAWFSEPVALLSASKTRLRAYHTPEVQQIVKETVDRFVASRAESHVIGMRLVTVGSPNWRSKSFRMLRAVDVETPGIQAWLVSKENAAVLLGELQKRNDFREHNSPNLTIHNGQDYTVARRRPRSFVRSVRPRDASWSNFDIEMGQVDEGFSLLLSPLFSRDGQIVDAVIKCNVDQIEKLVPIPLDVPTTGGQRQRVQIQIPQLVSWRLHERFRWPADEVLLLSCGVVATPDAERTGGFGISIPLMPSNPGRADALLFIENKGQSDHLLINTPRTANRDGSNYQGRY